MSQPSVSETIAPSEAFGLLSNDIRLNALQALFNLPDGTGSFTEIQEQVSIRDAGHLNYHLNQLHPRFVERTESEYVLRQPGYTALRLLSQGTITSEGDLKPHQLPSPCVRCGGQLVLCYQEGFALVACPDCDHWFVRYIFPPKALDGRQPDEIATVLDQRCRTIRRMGNTGVCPTCNGQMTQRLVTDTEFGHAANIEYECERCKHSFNSTVGATVVSHPAIVAFYYEHDLDITELRLWNLAFAFESSALSVLEQGPQRVALSIKKGSETLVLKVDETATVTGTTKR